MTKAARMAGIIGLAILVFTSATATAAPPQAQAAPEKTRFEYALGLYMQGAYDQAVKELKDFLREFPRGEYADDAWYWIGKYYMTSGVYDDGLEQFRTLLASLPQGDKAPQAQFEIGSYWYNPANPKRDYQNAIAEYLKIPYFYPDSPLVDDAAYYAAMSQFRLGDLGRAREELDSFIKKYPDSPFAPPAAYQAGLALVLEGKPDEALAAFQAVRDGYPAGLYRQRALDSIELIARAAGRKPLSVQYGYGGKGGGPGMLARPMDASADLEGLLYVADSGNARIQRFKAESGGLVPDKSELQLPSMEKALRPVKPSGIFVGGPEGLVYVTDPAQHRVQVFRPDGRHVLTFGRRGAGQGEMDSPAGIAVDEGGNIYVADKGNRRVDVFDKEGRFVRSVGNTGPNEDIYLKSPQGVALDIAGGLVVTDDQADRVYRYDPAGRALMVFGDKPDGAFRLDEPAGVCVDIVGNVYVVNRGSRSVLMLDRMFTPLMEFQGKGVFDTPSGISVTASGRLYVADPGMNKIISLK